MIFLSSGYCRSLHDREIGLIVVNVPNVDADLKNILGLQCDLICSDQLLVLNFFCFFDSCRGFTTVVSLVIKSKKSCKDDDGSKRGQGRLGLEIKVNRATSIAWIVS